MDWHKWMYRLIPVFVFSSVAIPQSAFAEEVQVIGIQKHILNQSDAEFCYGGSDYLNGEKEIQLLHVQLSNEAKKVLAQRAQDALMHANQFSLNASNNASLPDNIQLAMNKIPVLNQGIHGTCVTFAVTGAVDAILAKGDYISQLCQLQLGSYLSKEGTGYNNWNGSIAQNVIQQMTQFGIVNKNNQHSVGCGGLYHYPKNTAHSDDSYMETSQFQALSEPVFGTKVTWSNLPVSLSSTSESDQMLTQVKEVLNEGDRLIFGVLLPRTDLGNTGAVGKHNTWFAKDSWVLTSAIATVASEVTSAHEMIITGYDDNAVATDTDGVKHTGLLTLRNSWGACNGYYGDFYMSYDYFKLLAYDVKRLSPVHV